MDDVEAVRAVVERFCMDPAHGEFGPYRRPTGASGPLPVEILIDGLLYRVHLIDDIGRLVDIQVYTGLEETGGMLWEQEMRVLLRVGTSALSGLPLVLSGGFVHKADVLRVAPGSTTSGMALVATTGSELNLAHPTAVAYMRSRPLVALRSLTVLAQALATLHDLGICHRNLWSGAVDATVDATGELADIRLARFELSAILENQLRRTALDLSIDEALLRGLYRRQGRRAPAFSPPERWPFLFPEAALSDDAEGERADVFGLGVMVWDWFFGPLPEDRLPGPDDDDAAVVRRLTELHEWMRHTLRTSATVPSDLAEIIGGMLVAQAGQRSTAAEVVNALVTRYERLVVHWDGGSVDQPYLVGYMPSEFAHTVKLWDWIDHPPDTPQGREEVRQFVEDDLRRAVLLRSPHGAVPFVRGGEPAAKRRAMHLLLGRRAAWFCQPYRPASRGFGGGLGAEMPEVLLIKYVAQLNRPVTRAAMAALTTGAFKRDLPPIEVVAVDVAAVELSGTAEGRPSWKPLLDAVKPISSESENEQRYRTAIDWLLEYQGVELRARTYPFTRVEGGGRHHLIEIDRKRDEKWVAQSPMMGKFASVPGLRPGLGDFFTGLDDGDGPATVELVADDRGRPARNGLRLRAAVVEKVGQDRMRIEVKPPVGHVWENGWISPSDQGSRVALERQVVGRWDLLAQPHLLAQLLEPKSFKMLSARWRHAGSQLKGKDGPAAVRDMLTYEPFFALQGPPGTGKTTVTAEAIAAYLKHHRYARVLVSAQSNYALDNLASRVLARLGAITADGNPSGDWEGLALRVVSRSGEVDDNLNAWQWENVAVRQLDVVRGRVRGRDTEEVGPRVAAALGRWQGALDDERSSGVLSELADRVRRGANLVFATCAMATAENVTPDGVRSSMDWVVIEEAAKAWPTELAVPLTRGRRWTLVGDHRQLSAHRRDDIGRFLDSCVDDVDTEMALDADDRDHYQLAFDLFGSLFSERGTDGDPPAATQNERPLRTLHTQFRMREPIAEVVSRVFYPAPKPRAADGLRPGLLTKGREIEPSAVAAPGWLDGADLVWIDTTGVAWCADEPQWGNRGEATIVNELVSDMRPEHEPPWGASQAATLAVLSPYRRQNELLGRHDAVKAHLSTVHAFQGREADVVVVSLVRDTLRGKAGAVSATASLGHLTVENLANVLLSRAKRQLILVGRFEHFAAFRNPVKPDGWDGDPVPGGFWGDVCRAVELYGHRIPAERYFREDR